MMKPEEIECVREWAASGNKPRFAVDVEGILPEELWQMLDKDEDTLCELAPIGLTIAAQAERIRELELAQDELQSKYTATQKACGISGNVSVDRARRIRELEAENTLLRAGLSTRRESNGFRHECVGPMRNTLRPDQGGDDE
jgi:hypothetical protein